MHLPVGNSTAAYPCVKVHPWRGTYRRTLEINVEGVSTLDPSNGRQTNHWTWPTVIDLVYASRNYDDGFGSNAHCERGSACDLLLLLDANILGIHLVEAQRLSFENMRICTAVMDNFALHRRGGRT